MPNGHVHALMTAGAAVVVPAALWLGDRSTAEIVYGGLGALAGLVLTPDLDVDGGCFAFYAVRWALGKPASWCWRAIWWPYAKIVPHRSPISHSVVGTPIRIAYLVVPLLIVLSILGRPWPAFQPVWWWFGLGLFISDFLHISADWITKRRYPHHV